MSIYPHGRNNIFFQRCITIIIFVNLCFHVNSDTCNSQDQKCEFFLEISPWLPMRLGFMAKVYINSTDRKLFTYGDTTGATVDPGRVILADGSDHDRVLFTVNKTLPGPELVVFQGQEVKVRVKNSLVGTETSIHWHGLEMRGTPWMDGAAFVTQCPILPGQTFTYKFKVPRAGTFFYHAHSGMQISMGVYGALIVKKKDEVEAAEHVVMIQDYNNRFTFLDLHTQGLYGIFYPGGANFFPVRQIDGTISSVMEMTSSLINGRGRIMNGANDVTLTPLTVFTVVTGTVYRLRIINTATILQYVFSIDGHKLTVLSVDGNDVKPFETDRVVLHTGERCDVTIQANQPVKNYWVRAETLRIERQNHVYAILRYSGANIEDPTTVPTTCTIENPCTVFNCPFLTFPGWSCKSMDSVETPSADPVPTADDGPFKEFFVNTGFMFYGGKMVGQMNGVNNIMPKVSALTQPNDVTGTCDQFSDCGAEKMCTCTHVISVNMGDVVQLNFLNNGLFAIAHHSVHTHGYIFRLLKIGNRLSNASWTSPNDVNLGDNEDVDCRSAQRATAVCNNATWANPSWRNGNIPGIKMDHAVWKDTVTVPAGGYAVIRFKADNHGLWMVHCHMELHSTAMGMAFLLNVSSHLAPAPPPGFPQCSEFTYSSETASGSDVIKITLIPVILFSFSAQ